MGFFCLTCTALQVHRDVLVTVWGQLGRPPSPRQLPAVSCACCHGPGLQIPVCCRDAIFPGDALTHGISPDTAAPKQFLYPQFRKGCGIHFPCKKARDISGEQKSQPATVVFMLCVSSAGDKYQSHHSSPRQESSWRTSSRHTHSGLCDWHEIKGYMETPPACWGTFHQGHFAGALLIMPGFSFTFVICFLLGRLLWIPPNTECIEVNNITFTTQIPLSCNSSSVRARQISEFGLVEEKKKGLVV